MLKRNARRLFTCFFVLGMATMACNSPQAQETPDLANIVARTQTAIALANFLTRTLASPSATPLTSTPAGTVTITNPAVTPTLATPSITPTFAITQPPGCTNAAKFEGETVPDDTPFAPGEVFTKTWNLRNTGTCAWTADYALVFESGDRMAGASPSPLGKVNLPDGTLGVNAILTAPDQEGTYQGFWKLVTPQGSRFGLGKNADSPFWVQITVTKSGSVSHADLGDPTWVESFNNNSSRFYLGSDSEVSFDIQDGKMVMTAFTPSGDQWRVAQSQLMQDFYLEAQFQTGKACSGEDSYGMIVRAPDQADNFVDSGYIFTFSCAGKFRVYRMDNNVYTGLVNWTSSAEIEAGPDKTNVMGIKAIDDQLQLYANGKLVASFSDATYQQGYYGLTIRTKNTPDFQVFVDMVAGWEF
jgi:hypothetical protein